MSNYTTQLRYFLEQSNEYELNMQDYAIYDSSYRPILNDKIATHFYFRELGFETPEQFFLHLKRKMNEIMPRYNLLYKARLEGEGIDPFSGFKKTLKTERGLTDKKDETGIVIGERSDNVDSKTTNKTDAERKVDSGVNESTDSLSSSLETGTEGRKAINIGSDMPTSELILADLETNQYAENASVTNDDKENLKNVSNTLDGNVNTIEDRTETVDETVINNRIDDNSSIVNTNNSLVTNNLVEEDITTTEEGYNLSQVEMYDKFKNLISDIDMEIIADLNCLFMGILGDYKRGDIDYVSISDAIELL